MCAKLNKAGWEPVTHARSSVESIYVERFGPGEDGALYLTVFNDSHEAQTARITIDGARLGVGAPRVVEELVRGKPIEFRLGLEAASAELTLEPEDLIVLRLR